MAQNIVLAFYAGGGGNSFSQIVMAEQSELRTGVRLFDNTDITVAGSAGNFAALTSMLPHNNHAQSVFTPLRNNFKDVAKKAICGALRQDQLIRGVLHDINGSLNAPENPFLDEQSTGIFSYLKDGLKTRAARAVCKDQSGKVHLDPAPLSEMITECFGENTTINDLPKTFINFAHHHETEQHICFSNIEKTRPDILSGEWKDYFLINKGGHHKVHDTVMASIAAPTLFPAHEIDGSHYVDCASFMSPLPIVKNIFEMAGKNKDGIHIHVLYLGTGFQKSNGALAQSYNCEGALKTQRSYINFRAMAHLNQEMRELREHYSEQVTIHTMDIGMPDQYNGHQFVRDPFNGSTAYLSAIEDITVSALEKNPDIVIAPMERIAEAKIQPVDPLTSFQRSASKIFGPVKSLLSRSQPTKQVPPLPNPMN